MNPLILALDTDNVDTACLWIEATNGSIKTYKAGLEFFLAFGEPGIAKLRSAGEFDLFLDLKLHDIPNTVAKAAHSISSIKPKFLTVHASGGPTMVKAAVDAVPDVAITAVTILTSLSEAELRQIGYAESALLSAVNLAQISVEAGARAIVSSPLEVGAIRDRVGKGPSIITPGVRPAGADVGDQTRVMTPRDAIAAGSTYLVIGRPITSLFKDGLAAMRNKAQEILDDATSA